MDAHIRVNHSLRKMFVSQQMTTATVWWIVFIYMRSVMPTGILRSALSKWIQTCYICITPTIKGLRSTTRKLLEKPYAAVLVVAWRPHMKICAIFIRRLSVGFVVTMAHARASHYVWRHVILEMVEHVAWTKVKKNQYVIWIMLMKETRVNAAQGRAEQHAILICVALHTPIAIFVTQEQKNLSLPVDGKDNDDNFLVSYYKTCGSIDSRCVYITINYY